MSIRLTDLCNDSVLNHPYLRQSFVIQTNVPKVCCRTVSNLTTWEKNKNHVLYLKHKKEIVQTLKKISVIKWTLKAQRYCLIV